VGFYGIDRFYLGKVFTGILKLLTGGGLFVWWIIDANTMAQGRATDRKGRRVVPTAEDQSLIRKGFLLMVAGFAIILIIVTIL
jgi:hypothetical protein